MGVPVRTKDGSLFGTLCAIDPRPQEDAIRHELPTIELLGRLLGTVLSRELDAIEKERALERSRHEATTDEMTGLTNRRGWNAAIEREEARAARYGNPTGIIILDLDDLKKVNDARGHAEGDELIRRTARTLEAAARENDVVARLGGDEFGIIAIECGEKDLEALSERVSHSLADKGVMASMGKATRNPKLGLLQAVSEADRDMYAQKTARRIKGST